MGAEELGLGSKVYDSDPPSRIRKRVYGSSAVIAICITLAINWGNTPLFGVPLGVMIFVVLLFPIIPIIITIHLINFQERFKIYQGGVFLHTFKFDGNLAVIYKNKPYIEWNFFRFEEILSITPFLFTNGSMLTTDMGLRFILPHPKYGKVVGDMAYSARQINKMPEVVAALKAQMGPLWNSKYHPDEPASSGLLEDKHAAAIIKLQHQKIQTIDLLSYEFQTTKDVARYVENGITASEFKAISESKQRIRQLMKELI